MTHPTSSETTFNEEELDALVKRLDNLFAMLEEEGYYTKANTADFARKAINTLRAQLAEARSELSYTNKRLEHAFERIDRQARTIDELTTRTNRAEAALAAQIEADAGGPIAWAYSHAAGGYSVCDDEYEARRDAEDIGREMTVRPLYFKHNQPNDRTALERMLAEHEVRLREAREISEAEKIAIRNKALRMAAEICSNIRQRIANGPMPEGARFDYEQSILAMIDNEQPKENM